MEGSPDLSDLHANSDLSGLLPSNIWLYMRLYHFLLADYALDDLKKKRVKVSIIDKLNDPFEFQAGFTKPNLDISDRFAKFKSDISKEFGIFCCSKDWHNPLLWSHYADRHTGFALGFDIPDIAAIEVRYSKDRPLFISETLLKDSDNRKYLYELSRTKFSSWSYEEEVRIVYTLSSLYLEGGHYFNSFDDKMILKEVIIGCQSTIVGSEILEALRGYKNITLIQSRMADKSFSIVEKLKREIQ